MDVNSYGDVNNYVHVHEVAVRDLLRSWVVERKENLHEHGGGFKDTYEIVAHHAQVWAQRLGIIWTDDDLPGEFKETLAFFRDHKDAT